jgi:hypothetical protein
MNQTMTRRYLLIGTVSAILSLVALPVAGLGSIYSGYKIKDNVPTVYSVLLAGIGGFSLVMWVTYLVAA